MGRIELRIAEALDFNETCQLFYLKLNLTNLRKHEGDLTNQEWKA